MKKKYFLRGLGAGILFGAIVMLAAYMTSGGYRMSDDEIIERAEKLGMVMEEPDILTPDGDDKTESETKTTTEVIAEPTTETIAELTTTEAASEEVTTEGDEPDGTKATITISGGMSSEGIAALLEDAGLVESASDFNSYLVNNGYDMKLETGSFSLSADMSYEEIAKLLTKQQ